MKKLVIALALSALCGGTVFAAEPVDPGKAPVKIIFDTDMFTDYDDIGALAMLHTLADQGKAQILATVTSSRDNWSVAAVEIVNRYYGRADLPVGSPKGIGMSGFPKEHLVLYSDFIKSYEGWYKHINSGDAPDATEVYRKVLAAQPDDSVVLCTVGFMTNIRKLLESKGDAISPLDGKALVAKKVRYWVTMACAYPKGREYNSMSDWQSSSIAFDQFPKPIIFTDFQYGIGVLSGRAVSEKKYPTRNPVHDMFKHALPSRQAVREGKAAQKSEQGQFSWDETAVLAAICGTGKYFGTQRGRYKMVGDKGDNEWIDDPQGTHYRLIETMPRESVGKLIDDLIAVGTTVK